MDAIFWERTSAQKTAVVKWLKLRKLNYLAIYSMRKEKWKIDVHSHGKNK